MTEAEWLALRADLALLGTAGALGALLGLEREIASKPAGLRTHMLVAIGSALLVVVGEAAIGEYLEPGRRDLVRSDPVRVIQAIVVGISFLGAGTIIHERGARVEGLTTAASILLTAGIGIGVAVERSALAASVAVSVTTLLWVLGRLEARMGWSTPRPARRPRDADGEAASARRPGGAPTGSN